MTRVRPFPDPLARLHGHLFPWLPVCLGLGIGLYFALHREPSPLFLGGAALGLVATLALWRFGPPALRPFALAVALVALVCCWPRCAPILCRPRCSGFAIMARSKGGCC